jgi:glucosamine 6-phosphate synthetase-like amidotransferase/phosphosugar isomerase protein
MPRTGGTRFLLPYLPVWAILVGALWSAKFKAYSLIWMRKGAFALVVIIASFNVLIRYAINEKAIPVILGKQSKQTFVKNNLNMKTNLLDANGALASFISDSDLVHVVGKVNLYYAPFQVQHDSYGNLDRATHVLVYEAQVPEYVTEKTLLYSDETARIRLYKNK